MSINTTLTSTPGGIMSTTINATTPTPGGIMSTTINATTLTLNGVEYVRADSVPPAAKPTGPEVIVRTFSAGVHIGTPVHKEGREVTLANARRLWRWRGANTLNEVARHGVNRSEHTRISESVPSITLLEAIEIIPVTVGVDLSPVWNA